MVDSQSQQALIGVVREAMEVEWGRRSLHQWQEDAISHGVDPRHSHSPRTLVCAPAGAGKSTVLYGMATILGGVTLVITPTLALGRRSSGEDLGQGRPTKYSCHPLE
jgi:superfamily II DNA helicase RecQ